MSLRSASLLLLVTTSLVSAGPILSRTELQAVAVESQTDDISSGWCGRGILSLLRSAGLGRGLHGGNGQEWERILTEAGWKPLRVSCPEKAPLGSVLVYSGDARLGKSPRGTPGGYYGHVEMVAVGSGGGRMYVSDCARAKPGGTVKDNFTGRAWVPAGTMLIQAPPVEEQVGAVFRERTRMALEHFERKKTEYSAISVPLASGS